MKTRQLDITKQVDDFLDKLPPKQFKQVYSAILNLRRNPLPHDSKKLQGSNKQYRIDTGEFRIIYAFEETVVFIQIAGKRNDDEVYKKNKR